MRVVVDGIGAGRVASVRADPDGIGFIADADGYSAAGITVRFVPIALVRRFNLSHAPAGSATGGQFTAGGSGSSSSSGKSSGGKGTHAAPAKGAHASGGAPAGHGTAKPMDAHQKHMAHLAHMRHIAAHPQSAAPADRARAKAALLAQAKADRLKIAALQAQLKGLHAQEAKAAATAKTAAAKAASAKAGPHAKKTLAHAAAAKKTTGKPPAGKATLKQQIAGVQNQISALTAQVKSDEAQAAKL
jgi:hypothetical protein